MGNIFQCLSTTHEMARDVNEFANPIAEPAFEALVYSGLQLARRHQRQKENREKMLKVPI